MRKSSCNDNSQPQFWLFDPEKVLSGCRILNQIYKNKGLDFPVKPPKAVMDSASCTKKNIISMKKSILTCFLHVHALLISLINFCGKNNVKTIMKGSLVWPVPDWVHAKHYITWCYKWFYYNFICWGCKNVLSCSHFPWVQVFSQRKNLKNACNLNNYFVLLEKSITTFVAIC